MKKKLKTPKIFIALLILLNIYTNGFSQNRQYMNIEFVKEVKQTDTCIRFFKVLSFDKNNADHWFGLLEYIHNVVLILPNDENFSKLDEKTKKDTDYTSACENVVFYCVDGDFPISNLTNEGLLKNEKLRKKIILKFYYVNSKLIIDPFNYKQYIDISD